MTEEQKWSRWAWRRLRMAEQSEAKEPCEFMGKQLSEPGRFAYAALCGISLACLFPEKEQRQDGAQGRFCAVAQTDSDNKPIMCMGQIRLDRKRALNRHQWLQEAVFPRRKSLNHAIEAGWFKQRFQARSFEILKLMGIEGPHRIRSVFEGTFLIQDKPQRLISVKSYKVKLSCELSPVKSCRSLLCPR